MRFEPCDSCTKASWCATAKDLVGCTDAWGTTEVQNRHVGVSVVRAVKTAEGNLQGKIECSSYDKAKPR